MNLWSRLMAFFEIAPKHNYTESSKHVHEEERMHQEVLAAGKRHKAATDLVIRTSLDEVERARDVSVAIHTIVGRIEPHNDATVRLAQGAMELLQRTPPR